MTVELKILALGAVFVAALFAIACESEEPPATPGPGTFVQTEQIPLGTYTRTDDGKNYALQFRDVGRYAMSVDGEDRHVGTFTLGAPTRVAFDDRDSQQVCPNELDFGTYDWTVKDEEISFKVVQDNCDIRKDDFLGGRFRFVPGSFPTP